MTPDDEAAGRPASGAPEEPVDGPVDGPMDGPMDAAAADEVPAADGLDLARALMKATAGSSFRKVSRRRKERPSSPGRVSGSHPDDRDPQLLDATLGRLVADHGWELDLRVHGVFGRWADLVGAEIADHATPESFADGRLVVRTDSTAWATQLRLLAPTVVRRLNEELGHGTVTVIEVLGPHGPSWKKGRLTSRDGRGPRDTYG
jgi:predicted nucleic acid-binding Zn ribbon protein